MNETLGIITGIILSSLIIAVSGYIILVAILGKIMDRDNSVEAWASVAVVGAVGGVGVYLGINLLNLVV